MCTRRDQSLALVQALAPQLRARNGGNTEPAAEGCDAAELAIERERLMRLERALERLSANKRAVLTLCELEELPASRVAEILGCPEATVRSRLQRARADLANILKSETEDSK